ncbi:DNA helicase PcrA [Megasphaera elsdenii]|uniref:ATP-dependent DNA helicase n=1 Tax=Megasphaera elsdenii DSM 20460 TaxID=1064535 RepID=G0VS69_MEGEL|nr:MULTISPECIES: DNA helicase PcrA [Megasphaera]AVO75203.1 DNA helicase PcrA [Megasphaera elsdenii DSM 20460]MCQ4113418.1 DNA helicase PcrA [Megasphaera sp. SC8-1]CCC74109.1 ATP-dependent DNA helicase PcrA [Megasphaera elsdenii DSM 20460]SFH71438.1 DNA helicase-2 / ATP-dependent DNA helicase PcrA [Megasphaera elsdenii]
MNPIFDTLNDRQCEAVKHTEGPLLITAGAGSGKTKVLTCRIAHLLELGVAPYRILAITFTNKAAKEMKERVTNLVGAQADSIWLSTFHSFCAKLLRFEVDGFHGYTRNFTIYDSSDQLVLVKDCLKKLNLDDKQFMPRSVLGTISSAKNVLMDAKAFAAKASDFYEQKVADVYALYQEKLRENNAVDFDDLLFLAVRLLQEKEDVREKYQSRFQYILVDEYQDTNHAQYALTKILAARWRNICVVGDADQSIYAWRGADIRNIIDFTRDYPDAASIKLEQNYRSTKTILHAANAVIDNNESRPKKTLWTENPAGNKIIHYQAQTEHDEADYIAGVIYNRHEISHEPYGDMAILFRTNAQSRVLEEKLMRYAIPYTMVGGTKFYDRKEIKDVLAYLRLLYNPEDSLSLTRIINVPKRNIGATTMEHVAAYAEEQGISLFEALSSTDEIPVTKRARTSLENFAAMIFDLLNDIEGKDVLSLIETVIKETGYGDMLDKEAEHDPQGESRKENVGEFLSVAKDYMDSNPDGNLQDFLENVALVSDVDDFESSDSKVTLMTLHAAKGLEFPVVFLTGLDEGLFPHSRTLLDPAQVEEERRLAYVGITRAERQLYVTNAITRTMYGRISAYMPSRFLAEIPPQLMEDYHRKSAMPQSRTTAVPGKQRVSILTKPVASSLPKKHAVTDTFAKGDKVRHKIWGIGTVLDVIGEGTNMQMKIQFPTKGVRQVVVKYAPLEKI